MTKELVQSLKSNERQGIVALYREMDSLMEIMIESFGFEEKEDTDYKALIMGMAQTMESAMEYIRPEFFTDFNEAFDKITMVYFEPEKFFEFMGEYRDSDGVLQLEKSNISEFYGRSMSRLAEVQTKFNEAMQPLVESGI